MKRTWPAYLEFRKLYVKVVQHPGIDPDRLQTSYASIQKILEQGLAASESLDRHWSEPFFWIIELSKARKDPLWVLENTDMPHVPDFLIQWSRMSHRPDPDGPDGTSMVLWHGATETTYEVMRKSDLEDLVDASQALLKLAEGF